MSKTTADRRPQTFLLALALVLSNSCGAGGGAGDYDDAGDGDGDGDGDSDGDGGECVPDGTEVVDGIDNDCDELTDELEVCAQGALYATIADAIADAPAGAHLEVCAGTYSEMLVVDKPLHIRGVDGAAATILDADSRGPALIVQQTGAAVVTIEGFTVREGSSSQGGGIRCKDSGLTLLASAVVDNRADQGGGLFAASCTLAISDTEFRGNASPGLGGAAYLDASTGSLTGAIFVDNNADKGGAIAIIEGAISIVGAEFTENRANVNGGALYVSGDAVIEGSVLTSNTSSWIGGAVYLDQHAPRFLDNEFSANEAYFEGGAIYAHQSAAVLLDNVIADNVAVMDDGGGLRIFESPIRLERNRIERNSAGKAGGGFKASHVAGVYLDNLILDNIAASSGGGAMFDNDSSVVRGGRVSGNTSGRDGGGLHVGLWPLHDGIIEDVEISGNRARNAGGIYVNDHFVPVRMRGLRIENNTATERGGGLFVRTTDLELSHSLIRGNQATLAGGGIHIGAVVQTADPCSDPLPPCSTSIPTELDFMVIYGNSAPDASAILTAHSGLSVQHSIVAGHTGNAIRAAAGAAPTWRYNDTHPASFGGFTDPTGSSGNIAVDPLFLDPASGDFQLQAGSPCIDAGDAGLMDGDGSPADLGLFGGIT